MPHLSEMLQTGDVSEVSVQSLVVKIGKPAQNGKLPYVSCLRFYSYSILKPSPSDSQKRRPTLP